MRPAFLLFVGLLVAVGCGREVPSRDVPEGTAQYFTVLRDSLSGSVSLVSISPYDGMTDTLSVAAPFGRIIVLSTSYVGFLDALGCDSVIAGVSGLDYVSAPGVVARGKTGSVLDVGYDADPDYEKILSIDPDVLVAYTVSAAKPPFLVKLESLGIRVFIIHEQLENDPLARASYLRLFGAMTGTLDRADSLFAAIRTRYVSLRDALPEGLEPRKTLLNIPFKDQWFIPGAESYLSKLIRDAGGEVLGAAEGSLNSSLISLEKAYSLSKQADAWLHVGWCRNESQLLGENPLFGDMLSRIQVNAREKGFDPEAVVWNNNLLLNAKGGNDFWESGVVRPDRVLKDLMSILHPGVAQTGNDLYYYRKIE
jgi:iron complex transport system substrate-binding protein